MFWKDQLTGHGFSIFGILCDRLMIGQKEIQVWAVIDSEKPQKQPQNARN